MTSHISRLESPITVGIIGLGRAGWNLHFRPISALSEYKIVAVADPLAERTKEASEITGCAQFSSIDELLAGSDAQLIVVATPSSTHYEDVLKVLNAGRHCIAEKPLALKTKEADALVALAKEKGLGLFVHHVHVHREFLHHVKEVIASGKLGEVFTVRMMWGGYRRRWDWQTLKKNGGGQLNNTCPHALSLVLPLLGGRVTEVFADLRNIKDSGDAEDHVHLVLRTDQGVTADVLVTTAIAADNSPWVIAGKYGTLTSDGYTKSHLKYYDPSKVDAPEILDAAAPDRKYLSETLPWIEEDIEISETPRVKPFHENVLDVLLRGAEPVITPESAADVVRVSNLAEEAAVK